jgi:hypothetical protein
LQLKQKALGGQSKGSRMTTCQICNTDLLDGESCLTCGREDRGIVAAKPGTLRFEGFAPTIVVAGPDPTSGDSKIEVSAPGVTSEARLSQDGQVSLKVKGAQDIGRKGEPQALKTLRQRLQADGLVASTHGGSDNRGEDAILVVGSAQYTVQLVTSPSDPDLWRKASRGPALVDADLEYAIGQIRCSLEMKAKGTPQVQRVNTVFALDVRHAGILASKAILDAYLSRFQSPSDEFGLSSVWMVGPTPQYCARLGDGRP